MVTTKSRLWSEMSSLTCKSLSNGLSVDSGNFKSVILGCWQPCNLNQITKIYPCLHEILVSVVFYFLTIKFQ